MVSAASDFDLVIAGGRLVDPRNGRDGAFDVGVKDGRVAAVAPSLPRERARQVHDAAGLLVTPGLIDIHTHVYHKATSYGVDPDEIASRSCVSTLADAGSAGAGNVAGLVDYVIARSRFRILAYLNISFPGMFAFDQGLYVGEAATRELLMLDRCVAAAEAYRDHIVGIKVRIGGRTSGEIGLEALDLAIEAGERTGLPVMTHIGMPPPSYAEILERMRPGDILTHCFRPAPNAPVDDVGRVLPALRAARERGVLFDIGHGMGAFGFASAEAAIAEGFPPDIISSDVHILSLNGPAYDLLHTMSKLVTCGVSVAEAIRMTTDAPAKALRRDDLGHLGVGAVADIALVGLVEARYPFKDVTGIVREGVSLLRPHGLYLAGEAATLGPRPFEEEHYGKSVIGPVT